MPILAALALALLLKPGAALADPAWEPEEATPGMSHEEERVQIGAEAHWSPAGFADRLGLGLGFLLPLRWYDADGALLSERALIHTGCDLERTGLYLAVRF